MIITKKEAMEHKKGDMIDGMILLKGFEYASTKNGDPYIKGFLQNKEDLIGFKIWKNSPAFDEVERDPQFFINTVCQITGEVDNYNDVLSINLKSILPLPMEDIAPYLGSRYDDPEKMLDSLHTSCSRSISVKGMSILDNIFFGNKELMDRFRVEFAASSHHDNCKSGLLAHTKKVMKHMSVFLSLYQNVIIDENGMIDHDKIDLLMIGALLHDIGKIDEMKYGVYIEGSFITHRIIGLEYVLKYREEFVAAYGEMWFKYLESIIMQHHNNYGEPCRTVYSFLVHLADDLDSKLTLLDQLIPDAEQGPAGKTISMKDRNIERLNLM